MKIYLACSFAYMDKRKTNKRKEILEVVERGLHNKGYEVYNPSKLKIENAWDYSYWDWGQKVFDADVKALDEADLVIMLSFGKENNAGSAWECGYACGTNKKVILVSMNPDEPESLMMLHSAYACVKGLHGLDNYDFDTMPRTKIDVIES